MTKTIELTLEKPCDLKPGHFNLLKVDGKKLTVEEIAPEPTEPKNIVLGMFADKPEMMDKLEAAINEFRATHTFRTKASHE
jgi:hypothetical protein